MAWYIRSQNKVKGPFPVGQIQQEILLGRVSLNDFASQDKEEWLQVRQIKALIPDVLLIDPKDETRQARIEAAKRWADERRHERRAGEDPERLGPGRRDEEAYTSEEYRQHREEVLAAIKPRREKSLLGFVMVILFVVLIVVVALEMPTQTPEDAQCDVPARAKINWMHCQLPGLQSINGVLDQARLANINLEGANLLGTSFKQADLAYANLKNANLGMVDLRNARLTGANLREADLQNANLASADLSYANLSGAKIENVNFKNVILKNTIWVDGQTCAATSVGNCIRAEKN